MFGVTLIPTTTLLPAELMLTQARRKNIKFEFKHARRVRAKPMVLLVQCNLVERQVRV